MAISKNVLVWYSHILLEGVNNYTKAFTIDAEEFDRLPVDGKMYKGDRGEQVIVFGIGNGKILLIYPMMTILMVPMMIPMKGVAVILKVTVKTQIQMVMTSSPL